MAFCKIYGVNRVYLLQEIYKACLVVTLSSKLGACPLDIPIILLGDAWYP